MDKRNYLPRVRRETLSSLNETFISALHDDFVKHGADAIESVRNLSPVAYLRVIASILPKKLELRRKVEECLTDDQLNQLIEHCESSLSITPGREGEESAGGQVIHLLPVSTSD